MGFLPSPCAAIEVGTNSLHLLIGEPSPEGGLRIRKDLTLMTRLGEGLTPGGRLLERAIQRTIATLKDFARTCHSYQVEKLAAVGTNPLRIAVNARDFVLRVERECSFRLRIISSDEEARLTFLAIIRGYDIDKDPLLVLDIGGGSTEVIYGKKGVIEEVVSLPVGAVGLTQQYLRGDPVRDEDWEGLLHNLRQQLSSLPQADSSALAFGVGGTLTTLIAVELGLREFAPRQVERQKLAIPQLAEVIKRLKSLSVAERRERLALHPLRADIILAGAAILYTFLERYRREEIVVSIKGVRYGLLHQLLGG